MSALQSTSEVTYLIEGGNTENTFFLHSNGRLLVVAVPAQDQYTLRVRATDGGEIPKFSTALVNIFVNDTDCAPFDTNIM